MCIEVYSVDEYRFVGVDSLVPKRFLIHCRICSRKKILWEPFSSAGTAPFVYQILFITQVTINRWPSHNAIVRWLNHLFN